MSDDELLTLTDAAKLIKMPPSRVIRRVNKGQIPFVDLGDGEPRFLRHALIAWILANRKGPEVEGADAD